MRLMRVCESRGVWFRDGVGATDKGEHAAALEVLVWNSHVAGQLETGNGRQDAGQANAAWRDQKEVTRCVYF